MGNWGTTLGLAEVTEGILCCTTSTVNILCSSCITAYSRLLFSLFLLFGTLLSFLVLSPNMRSTLGKLPYFCTDVTTDEMCDNLVGYGAVYRICFSLALFYGIFALLMLNTESSKDIRIKFHNGYWLLKLVLLVGILIGAFHIPQHTEFVRLWMYVGLTSGFIFIMIQILLVIDFAHSWSFSWAERMESGNSNFWSFTLVISTILVYSMAITMAVFYYLIFTDIPSFSKCRGNTFLISFNVFHCFLASIVSVLPSVQDSAPGSGLLQSSIVSLYTMYLTWCTLSSEPEASCNPMGNVILEYDKISGVNGQAIFDCVLMFALLIFACNVRSSTSKLEKIGFSLSKYPREEHCKNSVNCRENKDAEKYVGDENIDDGDYLEYNYSLFHFVMSLASLQLMMVVTNWHSPDESADLKKLVKNWATVWIQLSSSFLCVLFYIWATVTPLMLRTWAPCLGLDYERVPTDDDYERLRKHREKIRERKEREEYLKSTGKLTEITKKESLVSKNYELSNSERRNEEKFEDLSTKNQLNNGQIELTQDSGMCDATNVTSYSWSVSRASAQGNWSKSTTIDSRQLQEHNSESLHNVTKEGYTALNKPDNIYTQQKNDLVNSDGNLASMNLQATSNVDETSKRNYLETSGLETEEKYRGLNIDTPFSNDTFLNNSSNRISSPKKLGNKTPTLMAKTIMRNLPLALPRPQSASSRLNRSTVYGKHEKKVSRRPNSSMALTKSSQVKEDRALNSDEKIPRNRPKTCEPASTLQQKVFLQNKENEKNSMREDDSCRHNILSTNQEYITVNTVEETDGIHRKSEEIYKLSSEIIENYMKELTCSSKTVTQVETTNVLKSVDNNVAPNKSDFSSVKELHDNADMSKDRKEFLDQKRLSNDPASETTQLKMKDHLKWVKSLQRTRSKIISSNKQDHSENLVDSGGADAINGQEKTVEHSEMMADRKEQVEDIETVFKSASNDALTYIPLDCSQANVTSTKNDKTLDQQVRGEKVQRIRLKSELQTPEVTKEILRLQEKILKFQAKVVKTQQKILEMQQNA